MRTTLDISDDVLFVARDFARRDGKTVGQVVSELARRALQMPAASSVQTQAMTAAPEEPGRERLRQMGIRPLPSRGGVVSNDTVNSLREQEGV
jgi:hypothetical protein